MHIFERLPNEINPGNISELDKLAKKWKISVNDLSHAIVETGSLNIKELHSHIRKTKPVKKPINFNWTFKLHLDIFQKDLR